MNQEDDRVWMNDAFSVFFVSLFVADLIPIIVTTAGVFAGVVVIYVHHVHSCLDTNGKVALLWKAENCQDKSRTRTNEEHLVIHSLLQLQIVGC